jgi:5-methylcytosine-specific restriction endonuclease McrA
MDIATARERHTEYMRLWRVRNREHAREIDRAYRERHPDRVREARRQEYAKHATKYREAARAWRLANIERVRATEDSWRADHPEEMREYRRLYAVKQRGATVIEVTPLVWAAIKEAYGGRCAYCGTAGRIEQDHVIPLSRGGQHTIDNVVPACRSCNARKAQGPAPDFQRKAWGK